MDVKRSRSMCSRECSTFLPGPGSRFSLPARQSESRTDLFQHEVVADVSANAASPDHNYSPPAADTESSTSVGQVEENQHEDETESSDAASSAGADRQRREKKKRITSTTVSRITALVILAIVIAGLFSVPIVVFIYKTRLGEGSGNRYNLNLLNSTGSGITATMGLAPPDRNCSEGFFVDETTDLRLCKPECGEWWPQPERQMDILTVLTLMPGAVGITLSIVVLLLSFGHYRTMFKFPGIFIFYQTLSSLVYAVVYVISYVDFKALFCGSMDLVESLMPGNETPMCTISAAAWIYISQQVALWWIFHLSMVFCAVFWPFEYQYWKKQGYFKYVHIVMVSLALTLPVISVMICFKVDGYTLYFLIRPDCVARNTQAAFYSHVVPLIIAVATGLYLLVLIFWKFFSKVNQGSTNRQVEVKILLLLCCYALIWTDVIGVTVATMIEADDYRSTLTEYFTCEAAGVEGCPRDSFAGFDVVSKIVAYSLVGLYPAIFLIYFVSVNKKCLRICTQSTEVANSTGSSASVRAHKYPHTHTQTDLYTPS